MGMNFSPPPGLRGDERSSLQQMHSFLFRLTEQLNAALQETDKRIETTEKATGIAPVSSGDAKSLPQQYNDLKSLIIKTADVVHSEMEVLEKELNSTYIAKSEWGEYIEGSKAVIEETSKHVLETYTFESQTKPLKEQVADFDNYIVSSSGYIRRGIIGYDENGTPIIGIAIGQDIKTVKQPGGASDKTEEIDGEVYSVIDMTSSSLATYTSDRVTFWQGGVEVAWFSNRELVCANLKASGSVTLGGHWKISTTNGFTINWIEDDE